MIKQGAENLTQNMMIEDVRTYWIEINGIAAEDEINATTPQNLTVARTAQDKTTLTVLVDQAGLIGILRYLHGIGFVLLSVSMENPNGK